MGRMAIEDFERSAVNCEGIKDGIVGAFDNCADAFDFFESH